MSSFFAPSSRFGTPEELKGLIDAAHRLGISVFLDIVHSHAAANEVEGLARFDGSGYQYFHAGGRGVHPDWGTRLFDYGKPQVLHFLLSNLKYWLEEYHFDGFRFDGVTSMLYLDHGREGHFDHYNRYFGANTDPDAVVYLQLAAELCRGVDPHTILIAEEMSGMPGLCLPIGAGGIGFDYRLAMGVPDFWRSTLRELPDENWPMARIWRELTQRRPREKVIGYCESHDQALVGDKTIMFWLADAEMYRKMERASDSPVIERAMALHKMIRLVTCLLAGEGYLNFMGNEFGHPEWIDFPREGNHNSYYYARRQWSLADDPRLRYSQLLAFDQSMISLARQDGVLDAPPRLLQKSEKAKTLIFSKGPLLCTFNFHPTDDSSIPLPLPGAVSYEKVLDTDEARFGGPVENPTLQYDGRTAVLEVHRRSAVIWRVKETAAR